MVVFLLLFVSYCFLSYPILVLSVLSCPGPSFVRELSLARYSCTGWKMYYIDRQRENEVGGDDEMWQLYSVQLYISKDKS